MTKLSKMDYLVKIQSELKAPKNQFNNFGKYKYRSAEDILEALKPLLLKYNCYVTITEKTDEIGGELVLTSKATISNGESSIFVEAQAGINPNRKGMDIAQSFGSSSSYSKAKAKMSVDIYNAMLEYINTGKSDIVASKMDNYTMNKKQKDTLTRMIKENNN